MFSPQTRAIIMATVNNDLSATPEDRNKIENLLEGKIEKKRLIQTKEACDILGVTSKTLYNYTQKGLLHPIKYSYSKLRYDAYEVEKLAYEGVKGL